MRLGGATIAEEMQPVRFDGYLDSVAELPSVLPLDSAGRVDWQALPIEAIRVRRWSDRKAKLALISPEMVLDRRAEFPRLLRAAYEIEEPWAPYTIESTEYMDNDGVRKLSAFMQAIWNNDERRHGAVFRHAYMAVTGATELPANPHLPGPCVLGVAAFERHLYARFNAELGASAAYSVFAAHTTGDLSDCILNVAGDEFRHLAIFWAALKWRFGDSAPWRVWKWLQQIHVSAGRHRHLRTGLERLTLGDALLLAEIAHAVALEMGALLRWDASLTPVRLHDVFGCPPSARAAGPR